MAHDTRHVSGGRKGRPAATAGLAVYATCSGQNLCLAGRRGRRRLCHAVHLLHAISSVCAAHLHHVAVASRHLRGIRHPDAPLGRSRGTRAILRDRLPLIVAGLLAVVGLAGECGARCGKGYAEQGIENTVFHDCNALAKHRGSRRSDGMFGCAKAQRSCQPDGRFRSAKESRWFRFGRKVTAA